MNSKNKNKGFTLIEIIATLFIISIILSIAGTIIIKTITKSKDESAKIAKNNILNSARIYTKEYSDEISWKENKNETNKFSCISINELINKNLLKKDTKYKDTKYVLIKKDEINNIISEDFDDGTCSNSIQSIKIPTSKEFCLNNLTYNGMSQTLTNTNPTDDFYFSNNEGENAGSYTITATLNNKNDYQWTDGTTEDKNFSCTIKKDTPQITLEPNGIDPEKLTPGQTINIKVTSNTNGTIILKSSNNDYYQTSIISNEVDKEKSFNIKFLSTRNAKGTITVTLIPEDKNNYNNSSAIYNIRKIEKHASKIPSSEEYCKDNLYYNGSNQILINDNAQKAKENGITFYNYEAKEMKKHTVTAILPHYSIWEDGTTEPKYFDCEIKTPTYNVCYNANDGTETEYCEQVKYNEQYTIKANNFTRQGYTFTNWNTMSNGRGESFTPRDIIKNYSYLNNTTLYAQWERNGYNINYDLNSGTKGNKAPTTAKIDEIIQISNPTKYYTITYNNNSTGATINKIKENVYNSFDGWTAINLNKDTAKCGNYETNVNQNWSSGTIKKYFKNLGSSGTTVTLIANWTPLTTTLPSITKTGYTCKWNTRSDGNGTSYNPESTYTPTTNITLYAKCTANKVTIKYNPNGGTVAPNTNAGTWNIVNNLIYKNDSLLTSTIDYDSKLGVNGLVDYYSGANLRVTKTGYSSPYNKEWKCLSGDCTQGKTFDQVTQYSADDFCDASKSDCEVILGVNWQGNKIDIIYSPNGGTVTESTNNGQKKWTVINNLIYLNNSMYSTTINYGENLGENGLTDYNSLFNLHITNTGYSALTGAEWKCLSENCTLETYSHSYKDINNKIPYDYNDLCDASNLNCLVVLGVNWQPNNYTITFNPNGGSVSTTSKIVTYNSTYGELPTPTRNGYNFTGWYTSTSGGSKISSWTTVITPSNQTLYARWTQNIDEINDTRYNCSTDDNGLNRISVLHITTCDQNYCNFSKLNGLTTINRDMTVFPSAWEWDPRDTWTFKRNFLGTGPCAGTTWYVKNDTNLNCRQSAKSDSTVPIIKSYSNCAAVNAIRTTTRFDAEHNWYYDINSNCYLSGKYLTSSPTCSNGSTGSGSGSGNSGSGSGNSGSGSGSGSGRLCPATLPKHFEENNKTYCCEIGATSPHDPYKFCRVEYQ